MLPMHAAKVTVWCGVWADGIITESSFKDAANRKVTVNSERYRELISNLFLQELDLHYMWCQQDSATCYTARVTMQLLRGEFGGHLWSLLLYLLDEINEPSLTLKSIGHQ